MSESNEQDIILLHKKADAYFVLGNLVHIKFCEGHWKRGVIKEVKDEFFLLDERLEGIMPIFFQEIISIEKFNEVKE